MNTTHPIRLLMLEDSPHDAELIVRQLERSQLTFTSSLVDNEEDFRSELENSDPDVILSDYHLPGFDGVDALRIAHILAPSTPFIFVSGSIGEERAVEALREGATDYVLKDRLSRLASAIVRALAERRERLLRRNIETALRASEQRFQYAAAATREIIWDWNLATSRIWFSDAMRDFWGHETAHQEVDAGWFEQRIHPDDRADAIASFEEAVARKERWAAEFRFARADESVSHVLVRGMVVTDLRGEPIRIIGAIFDITERLQFRNQLEQVRRVESLGRVAATVAHEFNNVLMGMAPLAERMARAPLSEERMTQMSALIRDAVSRGRRLTEQILSFSKPAAPESIPIALDEWLHGFMPELRALAGRDIELNMTAPDSAIVSIDPPQMQQVLTNLVVNARQAMSQGGTITIAADVEGDLVTLTVADEGTGMAPEVMERIFEPLFTTKRSGTGLGLAVAHQIITRHNGSIRVTSRLGTGTTFEIILPLARVEATSYTGKGRGKKLPFEPAGELSS
jgi:PAS domain S-box-containing protein